jgi:RNA-binding protein YhbY
MKIMQFQIGKQGLSDNVVSTLNSVLQCHDQVRISVLRSFSRERAKIEQLSKDIIEKVNYKCASRLIGFTIILSKLSKVPKDKSKAL